MLMLALVQISWTDHGAWNVVACLLVQTQIVGRGQEFEAKLDGNVHVRNVLAVAVLVPVMHVLDNFVKDHTTVHDASAVCPATRWVNAMAGG